MRDFGDRITEFSVRWVERHGVGRMRARWWLLALPVVAGLLLAGCSDDDEPAALPDPMATTDAPADPTPTEEPTKETTPDADPTAALEAEITEFFEEYVDVSDKSWTSKRALDRRREMFVDSCDLCLAGYSMAEDALADDIQLVGSAGEIIDVSVSDDDGQFVSVLVRVNAPAADLVDVDGEVIQSFEANVNSQVVYQMQRDYGKWVIVKGDALS